MCIILYKYSLLFYTMTSFINGFTRRFFSFIDFNISNIYILDITAIIFALVQMCLIYRFVETIKNEPILQGFS